MGVSSALGIPGKKTARAPCGAVLVLSVLVVSYGHPSAIYVFALVHLSWAVQSRAYVLLGSP